MLIVAAATAVPEIVPEESLRQERIGWLGRTWFGVRTGVTLPMDSDYGAGMHIGGAAQVRWRRRGISEVSFDVTGIDLDYADGTTTADGDVDITTFQVGHLFTGSIRTDPHPYVFVGAGFSNIEEDITGTGPQVDFPIEGGHGEPFFAPGVGWRAPVSVEREFDLRLTYRMYGSGDENLLLLSVTYLF